MEVCDLTPQYNWRWRCDAFVCQPGVQRLGMASCPNRGKQATSWHGSSPHGHDSFCHLSWPAKSQLLTGMKLHQVFRCFRWRHSPHC